jgi:myo-inositol catabolism protein IolC
LAAPLAGYGGFAVGRTLWWDPLRAALSGRVTDDEAVDAIAANYRRLVDVYVNALVLVHANMAPAPRTVAATDSRLEAGHADHT